MLFTCEGNGLGKSFTFNMEAETTLVDLYLVHQWAFNNTSLSVKDIIGKLGIFNEGVPMNKEASEWSVPDQFLISS
jgi:hypothetical protein